jgi:flagellar motor switch protein FliM
MSSTPTDNLSKKRMQQLLAAIGSQPKEDATKIECTEYNWYQPNYFNNNQLRKLDNFAKKVASVIAQKFTDLCHSDFNVTITSITQQFADEFFEQARADEQSDHYLAFGTVQERDSQTQNGVFELSHPCGVVGIPPQTAIIWVTQLLGEVASETNSSKVLSQLEESLLLDTAATIIEAFSESYSSSHFLPDKCVVRGHLPLEVQGIEEICKITFGVQKDSSENSSEAYFLIPCRMLEPVITKTVQADNKFSSQDISKAILGHLHQMPVSVTAQLASTLLSFEEIMSLQASDILLLDKEIDETIEVIIEGKSLFRGQPAKSAGKHAVVITELSHDME